MNTVIEEYKRKKKRKTIAEYTVRYAVSVVLLAILLFPYLFYVDYGHKRKRDKTFSHKAIV